MLLTALSVHKGQGLEGWRTCDNFRVKAGHCVMPRDGDNKTRLTNRKSTSQAVDLRKQVVRTRTVSGGAGEKAVGCSTSLCSHNSDSRRPGMNTSIVSCCKPVASLPVLTVACVQVTFKPQFFRLGRSHCGLPVRAPW